MFLAAGADGELAVPIVSVLQWVDGNAARRLVLVLELRSSGAEASCELAVPDRALSSKVRLALICGAMPGTWDGTAPLVGVFDVAAARVTGPGRDGSAPAATAYGLLAELDGRIAAGLPLSARLRGRDWPLPVAVADQGFTDKLDPALVAVSGPAPATDMAAALAGLEQAGVGVRRGDKPAVSVRITATSAAAAIRLRIEDLPFPAAASEKSVLSQDRNIDPALQALLLGAQAKGIGSLDETAKGLGVPTIDRRVLIRLVADSRAEQGRLEREVDALGGEVTAVFEEVIMARVSVRALEELPQLENLAYAAPQAMFAPAYDGILNMDYLRSEVVGEAESMRSRPLGSGALVSEGVGITGADRLHRAGITGKGVKIGIIDFGYQRYDRLQRAGEVPEPAATRTFNNSGEMASNTVHGTACAEIIHDMAPDATLYLAVIDGADDQIMMAANWLAEQGVDIISFSGGGHGGPHNGQALLDRFVDHMTRTQGIAWIVAAGNDGASHWLGRTLDANGDNMIDVTNPEVPMDVPLLEAPRPTRLSLLVYWDDWGADATVPSASQDIDAHLFALAGPEPTYVAGSTRPQNGRGRPIDFFGGEIPAGLYALALEGKRLKDPVNVHVVANGVRLKPIDALSSVAILATAEGSFAVGAVDVRSGEGEPFSSRGPTDYGRLKPQVVGPDHNISGAYEESGGRFPGTSAACPHVSGFAALLKQQEPELSQADLYATLLTQVKPMGSPVPNPRYGHGHIGATDGQRREPSGGGERNFIDVLRDRLRGER